MLLAISRNKTLILISLIINIIVILLLACIVVYFYPRACNVSPNNGYQCTANDCLEHINMSLDMFNPCHLNISKDKMTPEELAFAILFQYGIDNANYDIYEYFVNSNNLISVEEIKIDSMDDACASLVIPFRNIGDRDVYLLPLVEERMDDLSLSAEEDSGMVQIYLSHVLDGTKYSKTGLYSKKIPPDGFYNHNLEICGIEKINHLIVVVELPGIITMGTNNRMIIENIKKATFELAIQKQ